MDGSLSTYKHTQEFFNPAQKDSRDVILQEARNLVLAQPQRSVSKRHLELPKSPEMRKNFIDIGFITTKPFKPANSPDRIGQQHSRNLKKIMESEVTEILKS